MRLTDSEVMKSKIYIMLGGDESHEEKNKQGRVWVVLKAQFDDIQVETQKR